MSAAPATQAEAAAALAHLFDQRVAEAMPTAFSHALGSPLVISGWLHRAAGVSSCAHFGPLDADADLLLVGSLSVPTLLVLLLDKRQPAAITLAARDALQAHLLADAAVAGAIREDAERMARRAIQHLVQQQAAERAEMQSLYGREHDVPGVAPAGAAEAGRVAPALCTALVALCSCLALVLSACGGGGCNPCAPEHHPLNCDAKPQECK